MRCRFRNAGGILALIWSSLSFAAVTTAAPVPIHMPSELAPVSITHLEPSELTDADGWSELM